jgi:hypothetical protein
MFRGATGNTGELLLGGSRDYMIHQCCVQLSLGFSFISGVFCLLKIREKKFIKTFEGNCWETPDILTKTGK